MQALGAAGLTRVFCEGGGLVASALLQEHLADRLVLFTGGVAIGAEGRTSLGPLGLGRLSEGPRFALQDSIAIAGDVMQTWERA